MACQLKTLLVLLFFLLISNLQHCVNGIPQVPCLFIFGDSLSDNGNNNNLVTRAKANYQPYGIDFPEGPTGRFTNGRNIGDIIAELLGFENYIPPFASAPEGFEILKGVNYASGSAGIRNESGQHLVILSPELQGNRISLDRQLQNHQYTVSHIIEMLGGNQRATMYLSKCMYSITIGSNDYLSNYFLPMFYPTSQQYTPEQYAKLLIQQLTQQTLYRYGARKVVLYGLGQLGSIPIVLSLCGIISSSCEDSFNKVVQLFNDRLLSLVADLNKNLWQAKFIFINTTSMDLEYTSSTFQGSMVKNASCCELLGFGQFQCSPSGYVCHNRSQYMFWDAVHPTEAAYEFYGGRAYRAQSPTDAYPFDISYLAKL
ncbi:GDSL esterase/lipase At1g29670-like isoform X1 [Quercus lobata]|uniref:GDSL esterase/lipase At1g29670-like isoform X1 n=1 Tax=Quercus lobata TaxID=97700 RepID=UPI0012464261|nr:GDSL esterase/lipase At1g29670-like isoform X1 [Quercus lobata]